jgi:hypothetical protein
MAGYVAVLGPRTAWSSGVVGRVPPAPRVLLVEFPDSQIPWLEPRDVGVDEARHILRPGALYLDTLFHPAEVPAEAMPEDIDKLLIGPDEKPGAK